MDLLEGCKPAFSLRALGNVDRTKSGECVVKKISYYSAIRLLTLCNELCPNAKLYNQYINSFNYPEKQEVFL